ncbi:BatD family protein [Dyadobacter helix]|nr:BatD family protein [Dyadobacter sp. CECT 9275]
MSIEFNGKVLKISEPLIISVLIKDSESRPAIIFPEITGLEKRSKSATSAINIVDGRKVVDQTISQEYFAPKPGTYVIPEFSIPVNATRLFSEETSIVFTATGEEEVMLGSDAILPEPETGRETIFFSVQADKKGVFIREGFSLRISLYISEDAPVEMEFYRFNEQLQQILKKVRPAGCWEENTGIEEIVRRKVVITGKNYTEYNMYQSEFFPLTAGDINIPSVTLDMLVIDRMGTVNSEKRIIKSFSSKPLRIVVSQLPPHPLRDQVAVGEYRLVEDLSSQMVYPGESIRYVFKVEGSGNIAAIPAPEIQANSAFDFYPPDASQVVKRSAAGVTGEKGFNYFVVPRKDGKFPLGRYFQWIYFNTARVRYDTLRSVKILEVRGEDYKLGNISLSSSLGLYDNLENLDTTRKTINYKELLKNLTSAVAILLLIAMVWVIRK